MPKPDSPPLLTAGIHRMTLPELEQLAVSPFPDDDQRQRLFLLFQQWVSNLQTKYVSAILWIDGSYLTSKFAPDDIDCIMWNPSFTVPLSDMEKQQVLPLIDRVGVGARFGIDFYMESPEPSQKLGREAYWRGLFGFQHDGKSAKGFVELSI
ncbi:DUF6932 family protein [Duganella vulcania]|uniref:Uncharacterized protein n=1 Tax=Duganella vulcania TaxID=2692166 RepID=A0A845GQE1_9BURK|nr:hypothetical protein [Duganella vulcania]MYM96504.1 hypothetical protein [Duganella vulcania]